MIIDMRKAVLLLPIYVAWMVGTDLLFNSSGVNTSNDLPLWLIIGFTIMAVLVVLIVAWYLVQRSRGRYLLSVSVCTWVSLSHFLFRVSSMTA